MHCSILVALLSRSASNRVLIARPCDHPVRKVYLDYIFRRTDRSNRPMCLRVKNLSSVLAIFLWCNISVGPLLGRMSASALHVCPSDSVAPLISGPSDPTCPRHIHVDHYRCCFPKPRSHQGSSRFRAASQVPLAGALEYLQKRFGQF